MTPLEKIREEIVGAFEESFPDTTGRFLYPTTLEHCKKFIAEALSTYASAVARETEARVREEMVKKIRKEMKDIADDGATVGLEYQTLTALTRLQRFIKSIAPSKSDDHG
jgi:hypothetical protein